MKLSVRVVAVAMVIRGLAANGQGDDFAAWRAEDGAAYAAYKAEVTEQYETFLRQEQEAYDAFVRAAGAVWGKRNVWIPEPARWVQYSENLEERSGVDFERGVAEVQVMVAGDADATVLAKAAEAAVARLVRSGTEGPIEMFRRRLFGPRPAPAPTTPDAAAVATRYTVRKGDTLWGVSRRLGVGRVELARANGLDPDGWLTIGQVLAVPGDRSASPSVAAVSEQAVRPEAVIGGGARPMLAGQVVMPDGAPVERNDVDAYARSLVRTAAAAPVPVRGEDGRERRAVTVRFQLVPNHLRLRAEEFRPMVLNYARKHALDPSLVFAIIHTESSFNPRARSGAPAYGLMQLVPRSGARDAYRLVFKQDALVSGTYLYNPRNNIELGCAFVHILDTRYLRRIDNPESRMLCVIAAYNTGAGNVCRAFYDGKSVGTAAPIINSLRPAEVYGRLRTRLPYEETRNYVEKVYKRMALYRDWQ